MKVYECGYCYHTIVFGEADTIPVICPECRIGVLHEIPRSDNGPSSIKGPSREAWIVVGILVALTVLAVFILIAWLSTHVE